MQRFENLAQEKKKTHLFVGKAQFVFQNCLAVGQSLHLVGERVERLGQRLGELDVGHGLRLHVESRSLGLGERNGRCTSSTQYCEDAAGDGW